MPRAAKKKNVRQRKSSERSPRQRLSPAIRKTQILRSAAILVTRQGYLPLAIEQLAASSGVSKALFYAYFPNQYALFNALLECELKAVLDSGADIASEVKDIHQAALLCATLYFEHVARSGPLLHILLSDRYMARHVAPRSLRRRNILFWRLAQGLQATFQLSKTETLAALEMMVAIPEEAGRLVFTKELDAGIGRELCRTLIASSVAALSSPDTALRGLVLAYDGA